MLGATFIDDGHFGHKFKVAANVFTAFLRTVEPQTIREQPQPREPREAPTVVPPPPPQPTVSRPYYDPKNRYGKYARE